MSTHITTVRSQAAAEWRASWIIPLISLVALAIAFSHIYTIGVFLAPLQEEFGWSRTAISGGLTIVSVISVILAPLMGALIDRYGSRFVALPGLLIYCGAFAALSLCGPELWSWWSIWVLVGLGSVCIKPTVWAAAITARFDKGRGLAMAVALCGSGLGGMFLPYLASSLIEELGWRSAFLAIGAIDALLVVPVVYFCFDTKGRGRSAPTRADRSLLPGMELKPALLSTTFIRLAVATLVITVSLLALIVHLVPILMEGGIERKTAAATAGLVGASTVVGRLVTGVLLDRFSGPRIGLVVFSLPVLVCLLLSMDRTASSAIAVALLLGLCVGSEVDVVMYLASRYFGIRHFGILYGTLGGLTSLGTGLGPLLSGYMFDRYGSYDTLIILLAPCFLIAAALVGSLGRYPDFSTKTALAEPGPASAIRVSNPIAPARPRSS